MKLHELFNGIDDTFGLEDEFQSDYVDTDKIISMTNEKLGINQKKPFPKIKFIFLRGIRCHYKQYCRYI